MVTSTRTVAGNEVFNISRIKPDLVFQTIEHLGHNALRMNLRQTSYTRLASTSWGSHTVNNPGFTHVISSSLAHAMVD